MSSHSCCVAGSRSKVDWLRDFANRQKLDVEFACEYDSGCASMPASRKHSSAVSVSSPSSSSSSSSSSAAAAPPPQQRRIAPTLIRAGPSSVAPVPIAAAVIPKSLEQRHVKVTATSVGPAQRLVQIARRQQELKVLLRRMKSMSQADLAEASRTGKMPYPSDVTMEKTVLAIERRALIASMEGRGDDDEEIDMSRRKKKEKPAKSTVAAWTSKNVADLTNWLATLESRWITKLAYGTPAVLVTIAKPASSAVADERVDALLGDFVRLHPNGIYQPLVSFNANNRITKGNSALLQLGANVSLMKALSAHRVRVIGAVVLVLSDNRRALRKVFDLRAGGFVDHETHKPIAPPTRAASVVEAAVKSLLAPKPRTPTAKRAAAKMLAAKTVAKPVRAAAKAQPPVKRRRVLEDSDDDE